MEKFCLIIISLLVLSSCRGLENQELERRNAFVYAVTLNDLTAIRSNLIPPSLDSIYLFSNTIGIISPRETRIYYWPLTNRYLADWNTKNTLVEGDLEIWKNDILTDVINLQDYVIQYDTKNIAESLTIHIGSEAIEMYKLFKSAQQEYQQGIFDYYDEREAWIDEVDALYKKMDAGEFDGEFPMEPEQPAPFTLYSTEVMKGYPIILPEGRYSLRMRINDGTFLPESFKELIVFEERKKGVSYDVIPEKRWTKPTESNNQEGTVYVTAGTEIYLEPFVAREYRDLYYTNMIDPQDKTGRSDRWKWVPQAPLKDVTLQVSYEGKVLQEQPLKSFYVKQTSGSSLSYEVIPFDPETMKQISFEGFIIEDVEDYYELKVVLLDDANIKIPGSERIIRLIRVDNGKLLYPLSVIPFTLGLLVVILRQRKTKSVQSPK